MLFRILVGLYFLICIRGLAQEIIDATATAQTYEQLAIYAGIVVLSVVGPRRTKALFAGTEKDLS